MTVGAFRTLLREAAVVNLGNSVSHPAVLCAIGRALRLGMAQVLIPVLKGPLEGREWAEGGLFTSWVSMTVTVAEGRATITQWLASCSRLPPSKNSAIAVPRGHGCSDTLQQPEAVG